MLPPLRKASLSFNPAFFENIHSLFLTASLRQLILGLFMRKYFASSIFSKSGCFLFSPTRPPISNKGSSSYNLLFYSLIWAMLRFSICLCNTLLAYYLCRKSFSFCPSLFSTLINSLSNKFYIGKLGRILMFFLWQNGHWKFFRTAQRPNRILM